MNEDFIKALDQLEEEKNISKEELIQAVEASILSAYKKNYNDTPNAIVRIDRDSGEINVYETKHIVEEVMDGVTELTPEEGEEYVPGCKVGDDIDIIITPKDFGRIAAQNAKQMIMQKILEAERNKMFEIYTDKIEENVNGQIARFHKDNIYIDLGSVDAVLPAKEQIPSESYKRGDRIKVYIVNVRNSPKGVQIKVSRTHPNFLKRLFEDEVPEIKEGSLEIKNVVRDPGVRAKVAVEGKRKGLDVIGTCIGKKGLRLQSIQNEVGNERIDIVEYNPDVSKYITNALNPAEVDKLLMNYDKKSAVAVVDDSQLALAIGKEGKNVQLAAKLTGWKIDIKNHDQYAQILEENPHFEEEFTNPQELSKTQQKIKDLLDDFPIFDEETDLSIEEKLKELIEN